MIHRPVRLIVDYLFSHFIYIYIYRCRGRKRKFHVQQKKHLVKFFNLTFRYFDDVLSLNNPYFSQYLVYMCVLRCVVCFLLFLSVNSHYYRCYKTCHGIYLSQIHVFGFGVIFPILIGFCLMLSPFLCVCVCVLKF